MKSSCDKCGDCCQYFIVLLDKEELVNEEYKRWVRFHKGVSVVYSPEFKKHVVRIDTPCSKLKDGLCTIYKDRPRICAEYNCWDPRFPKP